MVQSWSFKHVSWLISTSVTNLQPRTSTRTATVALYIPSLLLTPGSGQRSLVSELLGDTDPQGYSGEHWKEVIFNFSNY